MLTLVGPKVNGTLHSLLAPVLLQEKDYDSLLSSFRKHYDPNPLVIAERLASTSVPSTQLNQSQILQQTYAGSAIIVSLDYS